MRPPGFWNNPPDNPGLMARVLAPVGAVTARVTARRVARAPDYRGTLPVVCVGNLTVGGAGKTPTVLALAERLAAANRRPAILSRGYGGRLDGPVQVDPRQHSADDVGDEPLLMSAFATAWISKDRGAGAKAIEADAQADVILLDDGFQNPSVAKSLSLVVVDAAVGFGNGRCMPAGPLRETVEAGLARADFIVAIGAESAQQRFISIWGAKLTRPVLQAELMPLQMGMDWQGARVLAFAGIGRPEKFFASLRAEGPEVVREVALNDHQAISPALMSRLKSEAAKLGAQLVTTEKDAVRLSQQDRMGVLTLPVRLRFRDPAPLDAALDRLFA